MGDPRTVYVGNVSSSVSEDFIRSIFQNCGPVNHIRTAGKRGLNTVYCFVEFADPHSARMATSLNGLRVADREIRVSLAKTASPSKPDHPAHPVGAPLNYVQAEAQARLRQYSTFHSMLNSSNIQTVNAVKPHKKARHDPIKVVRTIYVEGVGPDTKEQQLVRVFTQFGGIKALRLAEASASAGRRAWVEFDSQEAANKAKGTGSVEIGGETLRISQSMTAIHTSTLVMTAEDLSDAGVRSPETGASEGSKATAPTPSNPGVLREEEMPASSGAQADACLDSPNVSHNSTCDLLAEAARTAGQAGTLGDQAGEADEVDSGNEATDMNA